MCMHPNRPVTSIAVVKKNDVFPSKFRLKARMVDVRPKEPVKMIKVYCDIHRREYVREMIQVLNSDHLHQAREG